MAGQEAAGGTWRAHSSVWPPHFRGSHTIQVRAGPSRRLRHVCVRIQKMRDLQDPRWTRTDACEMHHCPRFCLQASAGPYLPRLRGFRL